MLFLSLQSILNGLRSGPTLEDKIWTSLSIPNRNVSIGVGTTLVGYIPPPGR